MAEMQSRSSGKGRYIRRRGDIWALVASLAVVVGCILIVWGGSLSRPERSVFLWINGLGDSLEAPLWAVQLLGSLVFVLGAAVVALLLQRVRLAAGIASAVPGKLILEWLVVKSLVERERPSLIVSEAIVREENSSALGFPSGHAILVFALATLMAPYLKRSTRWMVFAIAALAGFARVYLAAHNPLDVVAGAGLGIALGSAWNIIAKVPAESVPSSGASATGE